MSVLEVIVMSRVVVGGLCLAASFAASAAVAGPDSSATSVSPKAHARGSFFAASQNRTDVPAHIERLFKELDSNHDGFVTKEEIAAQQQRFDERAAKAAPKRAEKMFDRMDTDHDGKITQAEIDAARAARAAAKGKTVKAGRGRSSLFARADANKDGIITRAEFDAAAASGRIKIRHANMRGSAIVRMFDAADTNKDGRLSLEEAQQAALRQFDAADVNRDGVLTPSERRQASKANRAKRLAS
jgi:Ca2+-binding EF-hand superfamily protein